MRAPAVAACLVVLTACSGGGDENDGGMLQAFCAEFRGDTLTIESVTCDNCQMTPEWGVALDRDLAAAVSVVPDPGTTQDVVAFIASETSLVSNLEPAGSVVGVWLVPPSGMNTTTLEFRTYMGDVEQESFSGTLASAYVIGSLPNTPATYYGLTTTKPFHRMEWKIINTYDAGTAPVYQIYEICPDGGGT